MPWSRWNAGAPGRKWFPYRKRSPPKTTVQLDAHGIRIPRARFLHCPGASRANDREETGAIHLFIFSVAVGRRNGRCCRGVDLWQSPSRVAPSGLGDILGTAPWVDTHGYSMPPRLGLNAGESENGEWGMENGVKGLGSG